MILLIQHQEGMELKPSHKLILTTTPTTSQMKQPLGQATSTQEEDQVRFIEIETLTQNSQLRKLFLSIATSRIKRLLMDQGNL